MGIITFGILMAMRGEFAPGWPRSIVAGVAACILVFCLSKNRKPKG